MANILEIEMFVAKITTAMTKASEKMFDTREKLGTLSGGRLKLRKKRYF